jgi:hypothetical protein
MCRYMSNIQNMNIVTMLIALQLSGDLTEMCCNDALRVSMPSELWTLWGWCFLSNTNHPYVKSLWICILFIFQKHTRYQNPVCMKISVIKQYFSLMEISFSSSYHTTTVYHFTMLLSLAKHYLATTYNNFHQLLA